MVNFAFIATLLSVITSIAPMFSFSSSSLQSKVMQLELENYVLKTSLVQLHVKVDELIEQHKETLTVLQELNDKTIFDDIYKEFDRVYDRAASFFTTIATVNTHVAATSTTTAVNTIDNDVTATSSSTSIPSKSAYCKEEQLAPPEHPNNHDLALLPAARSSGSSPPQRTSSIQEQSSIASAVAATMSSLYSMVSPSALLLEQVLDFVHNGIPNKFHDLALLLAARSSGSLPPQRTSLIQEQSSKAVSPSALVLEQVVDFVRNGIPNKFHDLALLLAARSCSTGSSPPQRTSSIQEQSSTLVSPSALVLEQVVDFVQNVVPSKVQSWYDQSLSFYGYEILLPTVFYLEEEWGVSTETSVNCIAVFAGVVVNVIYNVFVWRMTLSEQVRRFMTICSTILQVMLFSVNRLFGRVDPQNAIVIASVHGWMHVIDYLALDPRRYEAICYIYADIDCFLDACLKVLGLTNEAIQPDVANKWNLLWQRIQDVQGTASEIRFTRLLVNKLASKMDGLSTVAALKEQLKTAYSNTLKTCPIEALPTVLFRIQQEFFLPHWPPLALREMSKLEEKEHQMRQSFMDQAASEMEQFLERVKTIFGITDLSSATKRIVEKSRNKRRLVHHPDKGGRRAYYDFLDKMTEFLLEEWFSIDEREGVHLQSLAEVVMEVTIQRMQTCSIGGLQLGLASIRRQLQMPSECEHLQLVAVEG
jgi:hypothetical protein